MSYNDEANHLNKPRARVQAEYRVVSGPTIETDDYEDSWMVLMQGIHAMHDEAAGDPSNVPECVIQYPTGPGLAPFLRRPVPVVHPFRMWRRLPASVTAESVDYQTMDFTIGAADPDVPGGDPDVLNEANGFPTSLHPEAVISARSVDAGTDFKTSLAIFLRYSLNASLELNPPGSSVNLHDARPLWVFWRVLGHVAAI